MRRALPLMAAVAFSLCLPATAKTSVSVEQAERFSALALTCVHQEYPNKISHVMNSADDVGTPSTLTPAFYGCFDWHSAVHGHWLLTRLSEQFPDADFAQAARKALAQSLTAANIASEVAYFETKGRGSYERPYGLAWLLQLIAELDAASHPDMAPLREAMRPLENIAIARFMNWLPKLTHPIRTGEHSQTAFAMGLVLDYARRVDNAELEALVARRGQVFYLQDRNCPLAFEPSGQDFLSPCLAEADLMRRILTPRAYGKWLRAFLPQIPAAENGDWLNVAVVTDKSDGKLAHLDGLNLSRAWMLEGMAASLAIDDPRRQALRLAAELQSAAGLASVTGEDYAGGHWLASFATYLVTRRGVSH